MPPIFTLRFPPTEIAQWAERYASTGEDRLMDRVGAAVRDRGYLERAKIGILRLLAGVGWPTASVLLHFCDRRPYPVLDFRALWSLGSEQPSRYTFEFWWAYTMFTRQLAESSGHTMRTVDRALWQYSKQHQPPLVAGGRRQGG